MPRLGINTPIGRLVIEERAGAIIALSWGGAADTAATPSLDRARTQIEEYFVGDRRQFDLPLAPDGTPYMQSVWREMSKIPNGETRTYGEIAKTLYSAPRAVGLACGRNPIPLLIPCHRVVGASGRLMGYSGGDGVETKRWLLAHEAGSTRHGSIPFRAPGAHTTESS